MGLWLGVDIACRAAHQVSCADETGRFVFTGWRFRSTAQELQQLWDGLPEDDEVVVVMEPTRNAWVPLAAWFAARGAMVTLVPPEQSADLRNYYNKHTKTDKLDSRVLARLPLLHPEGLRAMSQTGPADALRRAVRRRSSLVERRTATFARIDALVELLGPAWADALGAGQYTKTAIAVLQRTGADPHAVKRLGRKRLTALLIRASRGRWREDHAEAIWQAADATLALWPTDGLDFTELAADIIAEARLAAQLTDAIDQLDTRIERLYDEADPAGVVVSTPGLRTTLAAGILGRLGDPNRFANLRGIRSFTGLVPSVDQSGTSERHGPPTKAGDPGLREALILAADKARKVDPTLAARYHDLVIGKAKHHNSALCTIGATLITRTAACWRNGTHYELRDTDGTAITEDQGRHICSTRYPVTPADRAKRRTTRKPQQLKNGTSRRKKESQHAPTTGSSHHHPTPQGAT